MSGWYCVHCGARNDHSGAAGRTLEACAACGYISSVGCAHVGNQAAIWAGLADLRAAAPGTRADGAPCPHPPARLCAWRAYDGTLCVACCDCGAVLAGAADAAPLQG